MRSGGSAARSDDHGAAGGNAGIVQQLNAVAADGDMEFARGLGWCMVENIVHWLVSHGVSHAAAAERLQQLADTLMTAEAIAAQVPR